MQLAVVVCLVSVIYTLKGRKVAQESVQTNAQLPKV